MTEMAKTMVYVGVALAATVLAIATRPRSVGVTADEQVNEPLFPEFKDPLTARSLEVVKHDEGLGKIQTFEVAQQSDGLWVIPSHQNYPADAEDRIRDAATMFVDLKVIGVVGEAEGDHATYGVVEPDEKVTLGDQGVGTLVTIQDDKNNNVVQLIIGKKVKDAESQRFVRVPSRSRVYTVSIDPDKLSTKFQDWIQADLLNLNTWDIANITLKDYSVDVGVTLDGQRVIRDYDQRLAMTVHEDAGQWKLDEFLEFRDDKLQPSELMEGEELTKTRLDTLRDSLDDLKIVDVERKPKGMGADLKADKGFMNDREAMASLMERGFYPVASAAAGDDKVDLLCSDGELLINTKEGVQYMLRFGGIAGVETGEGEEGQEQSQLNRFMFVSARVNDAQFPMPELEPLPDGATGRKSDAPPAPATTEQNGTDGAPAETGPVDSASGDSAAQDGSAEEASPPEAALTPEATESAAPPTSEDDEAGDADADAADQAPATDDPDAAASTEEAGDQSAGEASTDANPDDEISRINKENQRKLDERRDNMDKARKKVAELNYRFADWYYVISEEVFRKLHLGRADIIGLSEEAKKEGPSLDAFRNLEKSGLSPEGDPAEGTED